MSSYPRPYLLDVQGAYHRVRYDPDLLVRGATIKVRRGRGATTRLVTHVVHTNYDPRLGRVIAHRVTSRILRDVNPLHIWEVTDASS